MKLDTDIKDVIYTYLDEYCGLQKSELSDEMPLFTTGLLSSLSAVKLVNFLSSYFNFNAIEKKISIADIDTVQAIEAKIKVLC